MKILAVSDMVVDRLYSSSIKERMPDIELIIGCGDLPNEYLEFLVTAMNVPLVYVPGNHDPQYDQKDNKTQAQGGDFLDGKVTTICGLTIAGLGGSVRYRPCCANQYTQTQMYRRMMKFMPKLALYLSRKGHDLDIMIAHSPPRFIHDDDDPAHMGFHAFRNFIQYFKPRYFLHGHTNAYRSNIEPPVTMLGSTTIINVNPYRIIEV